MSLVTVAHVLVILDYRQISNIIRTSIGNSIVCLSDVVGASPVGTAPTTSSFSSWHLALIDCAKTIARRHEKPVSFGIRCDLYQGFDGISETNFTNGVWARCPFLVQICVVFVWQIRIISDMNFVYIMTDHPPWRLPNSYLAGLLEPKLKQN